LKLRHLLPVLLVLAATNAVAQKSVYKGFPSLVWPKLYNVTFTKSSDQLGEFQKPVFSAEAKSLNGKSVSMPGYIVPFENGVKSSHFMFSATPLNACFFCGVGGPESVVEVYASEEITYTDKPMEIKGVLRLNDKDPDKMIYILEKAELVGPVEL
jgi:hypothetical protein